MTETVFTKTEMNNEWKFQVPLAFINHSSTSFPLVQAPLKLLFCLAMKKKSHRTIFGQYGGFCICIIPFVQTDQKVLVLTHLNTIISLYKMLKCTLIHLNFKIKKKKKKKKLKLDHNLHIWT